MLVYGRTKAAAEPLVLQIPGGLVARISLLYGPSRAGRASFFDRALASLRADQPQVFFEDEFRTPIDYATAARTLIRLAENQAGGMVHVAGRERVSRYELMQRAARALGLDPDLVRAQPAAGCRSRRTPTGRRLTRNLASCLAPARSRPTLDRDGLADAHDVTSHAIVYSGLRRPPPQERQAGIPSRIRPMPVRA